MFISTVEPVEPPKNPTKVTSLIHLILAVCCNPGKNRPVHRSTCPLFTRPFSLLVRPSFRSLTLSNLTPTPGNKKNTPRMAVWYTKSDSPTVLRSFYFLGGETGSLRIFQKYYDKIIEYHVNDPHRNPFNWVGSKISSDPKTKLFPVLRSTCCWGTSITDNITQISRVFPTSLLNASSYINFWKCFYLSGGVSGWKLFGILWCFWDPMILGLGKLVIIVHHLPKKALSF